MIGVVLGLLAATLGACGEGGSSASGLQQEDAPSKSNPVTLTVWDWDYFPTGLEPFLSKVDKEFEQQNPGVTVDHVGIPYESAPEKFHSAVAARQGPDVMTMYAGAYTAPYQQGLVPLEEQITSQQRKEWMWLQDSVSPNGHTYVVPFATDGEVLAYNKELFAEAGVTPPKTWDEWLSSCEQLSAAGIVPQAGGWKDGELLSGYYEVLSTSLLTPAEQRKLFAAELPLDGPKFVKSLELFKELQQHECFGKNVQSYTFDEAISNFAAGKAASILQFLAFGPLSKDGIYPKNLGVENIGVTPVPLPPGTPYDKFMSSGPRSGWAIANWSKHQELAWKYITFMMRRKSFEIGWNTVELLPSIRGFQPQSKDYPPASEYLQWLQWPDNNSTFTAYPADVLEILNRQAVPLSTGAVEPEQVLGEMQEQEQIDKER